MLLNYKKTSTILNIIWTKHIKGIVVVFVVIVVFLSPFVFMYMYNIHIKLLLNYIIRTETFI
jgi:hypothetical protein